jgi:hypothetical protein
MRDDEMNPDESMNKELLELIEETKQSLKINQEATSQTEKEPIGTCLICNDKPAKFICLKCGRSVCPSCYYKIIGICKKCVPKEIAEKWDGKHPNWGKELGVDWVF